MDFKTPKLKLHPVVVGINNYQYGKPDAPLAPLNYAESDAQMFAEFLKTENPAFEVPAFDLFIGQNATAFNINQALRLRFGNVRQSVNDVIVFYFAGHGLTTRDGFAYLACYGANPRDPANDALRLDDLYNRMQSFISGAAVMLVLDACYSGAITSDGYVIHNATQAIRGILTNAGQIGSGARVILAAANANQTARESAQVRGGVFTNYLLRGWRDGEASAKDGLLTPGSLAEYLASSFSNNREQFPVTSVTSGSQVIIGRFGAALPQPTYAPDLQSALQSMPLFSSVTSTISSNPTAPFTASRSGSTIASFDQNRSGAPITGPAVPPAPPPIREDKQARARNRRNLIYIGGGVLLAVIISCAVSTFISPTAYNIWFGSAIALTVLSLPLSLYAAAQVRGAGAGCAIALAALVIALAQVFGLLGVANAHYGLGAGIGFFDGLAQYAWVAVVIYALHVLLVIGASALMTAHSLFSD